MEKSLTTEEWVQIKRNRGPLIPASVDEPFIKQNNGSENKTTAPKSRRLEIIYGGGSDGIRTRDLSLDRAAC